MPGGHPRTMKIVSPSPLSKIPLNYGGDGGGLALWSKFCYSTG